MNAELMDDEVVADKPTVESGEAWDGRFETDDAECGCGVVSHGEDFDLSGLGGNFVFWAGWAGLATQILVSGSAIT